MKSPQLNAFALPNGRIYINQGLLARFQNEAQLATVMAHEGTHFTNRHGYQNTESLKDNSAFATFGAMLGVPILPAAHGRQLHLRLLARDGDRSRHSRVSRG